MFGAADYDRQDSFGRLVCFEQSQLGSFKRISERLEAGREIIAGKEAVETLCQVFSNYTRHDAFASGAYLAVLLADRKKREERAASGLLSARRNTQRREMWVITQDPRRNKYLTSLKDF